MEDFPPSAVDSSLIMGLDFSRGYRFAKDIKRKFLTTVHPTLHTGHFILVVSFDRATFRLTDDYVGLALEAAIGGYCVEMKAFLLHGRTFSFNVSSKQVGFKVYNLRSFQCKQFKCFFHLWGRGGPNWRKEFRDWQREEEAEWTLVSPSKKKVQLGLQALKLAKPKSIIK